MIMNIFLEYHLSDRNLLSPLLLLFGGVEGLEGQRFCLKNKEIFFWPLKIFG